ncbi:response regulator transcription factor [Enterococcus sp. AZ072]|uniref:response regulator transcription factor n=1 Tax=unclassified Enterococcus TaxID=2608891 RepID=UPI003D2AF176
MRQKNVLLVDDDKDLCLLIERELKLENYAVTVCNDGKSGLEALNRAVYQLIILDIMLPILNGLEVLEEIRRNNHIPVLMLTAKDSEVDKVSGLRLGADDYLTKPFLMSELIARTHSLIRRYTVFNENQKKKTVLQFKGLAIHPDLRKVVVNGEEIQLTAKEFDLLYFLAANQGKVFTKEQIYIQVWQDDYAFDDRNIMSFISKLRKKIRNEKEHLYYIQTIHGIGYRFSLGV